ncbi:MAG: glycosyltransferase [Candidatus Altiarchaeota archaeon]|nr:glycosyltransferase [Candidatus Altiarchaeota archaeon]
MQPKVSIIMPSHNEGRNIHNTIESILNNTGYENYEVIVVDDGSTDSSCDQLNKAYVKAYRTNRLGAARARNYGASKAKGEILIFLDAHMTIGSNWMTEIVNELEEHPDSVVTTAVYNTNKETSPIRPIEEDMGRAYGITFGNWRLEAEFLPKKKDESYEVPMAIGHSIVVRRDLFNNVGGFDNGLIVWSLEDIEFCMRIWLMGFSVRVIPYVELGHKFGASFPYHMSSYVIDRNTLRIAFSHFKPERYKKVVEALMVDDGFWLAYISNLLSDVHLHRHQLQSRRKHNDDWFFERFNMEPKTFAELWEPKPEEGPYLL